MPRTDGTDDKRWYNLHVHWIYQSMTDTLCPGQIIKCDWLRLEWTKLKSISGMCFFSKGIAESSDQVSNTPSFHSVQNFKAVLLVQRATGPPVLPETAGHDCGCELWRCSWRASFGDDHNASHHWLWPLTDPAMTRPPDIFLTQLLESKCCLKCWNKTRSFQNTMGKPYRPSLLTSPDLPQSLISASCQ